MVELGIAIAIGCLVRQDAAAAAGGSEVASGWALTLRDESGAAPWTTRADAAAFALAEGEALEPEVGPGFTATFDAIAKIARAGRYRFGLEAEGGQAKVAVASDREEKAPSTELPLDPSSPTTEGSASGARRFGPWIELAAGDARVRVQFVRSGVARARLRAWWEMERSEGRGFAAEPIATNAVRVAEESRRAVEQGERSRRGRDLLVQFDCVACHVASGALARHVGRAAPIPLDRVAARASGEWLEAWISDPQRSKPGCAMPTLLTKSDADRRTVASIVALLEKGASRDAEDRDGKPAPPDPTTIERGARLYHEIGCVACHGPLKSAAEVFGDDSSRERPHDEAPSPFGGMRSKWSVAELSSFLVNPIALRPDGRMPSFGLEDEEARALASFLSMQWNGAESDAGATKRSAQASKPTGAKAPDAAQVAAGARAFAERGCSACHSLDGRSASTLAAPALDELSRNARRAAPSSEAFPVAKLRGCLAASAAARGIAPAYSFSDEQRADLAIGLASLARAVDAPAPLAAASARFEALRCGACHERDGSGGPRDAFKPYFRSRVEADLGDEGRFPPRLDGAGFRLRRDWMEKVISEGARARPYLSTRMPHFGAEVGRELAAAFAAREGVGSDATDHSDPAATNTTPTNREPLAITGRQLAGSNGLNCVTCHSFGARPSAGTPGLDFRQFAQRLRREYWEIYALAPSRFKPQTRMPTFFPDGKSALATILDGDAARQIESLWYWFERCDRMQAPDGVPTGQRMILAVGDRPKVFRTFLERAGNRGIAVGTPVGLHFAFDAERIQLVEAWQGDFLDVAPVWTGRGGQVAPELGPLVWSAPRGPPLLSEKPDGDWPDESGRALGLKFHGYRIERDGTPTFLYSLQRASGASSASTDPIDVEERFVPEPRDDVLFVRTFVVRGLGGARVWFNPGEKASVHEVDNGEARRVERAAGGAWLEVGARDASRPVTLVLEIAP